MNNNLKKNNNICYTNARERGVNFMYASPSAFYSDYKQTFVENKKDSFLKEWSKRYRMAMDLKRIVKTQKVAELIAQNIVKDKNICGGEAIIKGTRLTVKNLISAICESETHSLEELKENFPSITNDDQILAAISYDIRKTPFLFLLL